MESFYWETSSEVEVVLRGLPNSFNENKELLEDMLKVTYKVKVTQNAPGAGGGLLPNFYVMITEVVYTATVAATAAFLYDLAKLTAKNVIGEGNRKTYEKYESTMGIDRDNNNGIVPLGYSCNNVVFLVHRTMSNKEQAEAFHKAAKLVDLERFQDSTQPKIYVFWDGVGKEWREGPPV